MHREHHQVIHQNAVFEHANDGARDGIRQSGVDQAELLQESDVASNKAWSLHAVPGCCLSQMLEMIVELLADTFCCVPRAMVAARTRV